MINTLERRTFNGKAPLLVYRRACLLEPPVVGGIALPICATDHITLQDSGSRMIVCVVPLPPGKSMNIASIINGITAAMVLSRPRLVTLPS